jgi:N-formylglutamate amidohydrolase
MMTDPFFIVEPDDDSPLLVEIPHAGLRLDAEAAADSAMPVRAIAHDADLYVDALFAAAPQLGSTLIGSHVTRHVIDLNTAPGELSGVAVGDADEMVWHRSQSGDSVIQPRPTDRELSRRREQYLVPYHATIEALLARKRERFGRAVLLCAHSFPPPRGGAETADIVIGWRGGSSSEERWVSIAEDVAAAHGWTTARDDPHAGGYAVQRHGDPEAHVSALQVELLRSLYMDTKTLARDPDRFAHAKHFCCELVRKLLETARS